MKWSMPHFDFKGVMCGMAAFKEHCAFGFWKEALIFDREKAAVYGVTLDQIRQELFDAFGARQVASIYTSTNDYQVILESQPQFQVDPTQLQNIYVKTLFPGSVTGPGSGVNGNGVPSGQAVPLSAITRMVPNCGPSRTFRRTTSLLSLTTKTYFWP